jgi:hypothetical protein
MTYQHAFRLRLPKRISNVSLLRTLFKDFGGVINYRSAAKPKEDYLRKGGNVEDTVLV